MDLAVGDAYMSCCHSSDKPRGGGQFLLYRRDAVNSGAISRTFVDLHGETKRKTQGQISKEAARLWKSAPEGVKLLYRGLAGLQEEERNMKGAIHAIEDDTGALTVTKSNNGTPSDAFEIMLATPIEAKSNANDDPFGIQELILTPDMFRAEFETPMESITDNYSDLGSFQMFTATPESSSKDTGAFSETSDLHSCSAQAFIATSRAKPGDDVPAPLFEDSAADALARQRKKAPNRLKAIDPAALEAEKIPRPMNAFFLYRRDALASGAVAISTVSAEGSYRRRKQPEISKDIAFLWNNAPDEVRAYYKALAETKDREHKQKYPGYRYSPKRRRKACRKTSHPSGSQAGWLRATRSNSAFCPYVS
ncbi:slightly ste11-like protein [Marasmius sp. AFHP31]|nr:slightly ste11-like protein [Marasmius sp. AFHP31]